MVQMVQGHPAIHCLLYFPADHWIPTVLKVLDYPEDHQHLEVQAHPLVPLILLDLVVQKDLVVLQDQLIQLVPAVH